jgi:sec-independent protein translocase protein TatC
MQFILAFGVSFLLPVLLMLLNRAGIVSRDALVKARRYVIVGIVALAALITPPDVVSQLMLAVPLLILFEGTLILMRIVERKDAEEKARAEAEAAAQAGTMPGEPTHLLP